MRLVDLDPRLIRYEERPETWDIIDGPEETWRERGCPTKPFSGMRQYQPKADTIAEAQGIVFQCPVCKTTNGHYINVTFRDRGVPDHLGSHNRENKPSRWAVSGTSFEDLTLHPSVDVGCWHGWVTNGEAK